MNNFSYARATDVANAVNEIFVDNDLKPRDMIDIQSFIWVQGSSEYDE